MSAVVGILLAVNTIFIVLIYSLFRRYREEMKELASHAKAYYSMARARESITNRTVEDIPAVVEQAIQKSAGSGILGSSDSIPLA